MNRLDEVVDMVRLADPLDETEVRAWTARAADGLLLDVLSKPTAGPTRRHRSRAPIALAIAVATGATGVAAASGLLGGPAPDRVKEHLAELDAGMPADLRLKPDVERARSVAAVASGVLYLAELADGGYCLEVVSDGDRPRGAACVPSAELLSRPLEVTAPIPAGDDAPILVGGRINADRIVAVQLRYADGVAGSVPLGLDRAWLAEVPDGERESAFSKGVVVAGLDGYGHVVATVDVAPLRDDDATGTAHDAARPIVATTISDGRDFTLVRGIEGRVNVDGAATAHLRYPDGTTAPIVIFADGRFTVVLPADRQGDLDRVPGSLVVLDRRGRVIASAPIASVSYWRGRNR